MIKTITLGPESEPTVSLCPGHVDAKVFNEAYINEGWDGYAVKGEDLEEGWWREEKDGYKKSTKLDVRAAPYTALYW